MPSVNLEKPAIPDGHVPLGELVQDGRIHIEKINGPFLFKDEGSPAEYGAGLRVALERGGS